MTNRAEAPPIALFSACLPGWSASQVIEVALSLGFPAVEWGCGPGHAIERPEIGAELGQLCERAGLRSGGLSVQDPEVTLATPRTAAPHVALAVALGAPHVRLLAPPYRGGSLQREQQRVRSGLDFLVDLAAPSGIAVLVETSPMTLAPAPEFAAALVEQHPPEHAGVLYDPGNMAVEGHLTPALAIARLGGYLRHVHVKNIAWSHRGEAWHWRHASLANGMLDWRAILDRLALAGYEGTFSIDHLGGTATRARLSAESSYLRALMADAFTPAEARIGSADGDGKGGVRSSVNA
jgi:sugar phosphate isomerase/epimerase